MLKLRLSNPSNLSSRCNHLLVCHSLRTNNFSPIHLPSMDLVWIKLMGYQVPVTSLVESLSLSQWACRNNTQDTCPHINHRIFSPLLTLLTSLKTVHILQLPQISTDREWTLMFSSCPWSAWKPRMYSWLPVIPSSALDAKQYLTCTVKSRRKTENSHGNASSATMRTRCLLSQRSFRPKRPSVICLRLPLKRRPMPLRQALRRNPSQAMSRMRKNQDSLRTYQLYTASTCPAAWKGCASSASNKLSLVR